MAIADDNMTAAEPAIDPAEAPAPTPLEAWLAARRTMIGASESPSILGCGYADEGPWTIWAKKTGQMEDKPDNELLWYGREMQPITLKRFTIETGLPVRDLGEFTIQRHPTISWLGATLDGVATEADGELAVVEAKNIGHYGAAEWNAPEPPLRVQVQIQHQLAVTCFKVGYAAATVGGNKLAFRRLERNERFIAAMIQRLEEFWRLVREGRPPEIDYSEATAKALRAIHPDDNGAALTLPPESLIWDHNLERVKRHIKILKRFEEEYKNRIKAAIGDASFGELPDGSGEGYSWKSQDVAEFVTAARTDRILRRAKANKAKTRSIKGGSQRALPPNEEFPRLATDAPETVRRPKITVAEIRNRLLEQKPHCRWCGKTLTKRTATLEHVVPKAHGGTNRWENLDLACKPCNHKRGDTGLDPDFLLEE